MEKDKANESMYIHSDPAQKICGREMFETWYKMTAMLQSGLDISPLITHSFPYTDFLQGFEVMCFGQSGKVILNWDLKE